MIPWCVFSPTQTEYRDLTCKSSYSIQVRKNAGQRNSEYEHFLRSDSMFISVLSSILQLLNGCFLTHFKSMFHFYNP